MVIKIYILKKIYFNFLPMKCELLVWQKIQLNTYLPMVLDGNIYYQYHFFIF